jgi:5-methylcytosine-specific restriction enzyme A
MTRQRTISAYEVSKLVYQGGLTARDGATRLAAEIGMNTNSARDHFYVYRQLRSGAEFHRGLSVEDMNYYLTRLEVEEGADALRLALHSLSQHISYYESIRKFTMRSMREMLAGHERRVSGSPLKLSALVETFAYAVASSEADSSAERRKRLASAPKRPAQVLVLTQVFARNADVVAEVLARAAGTCERCAKAAPFLRRRDASPYLEVHHREQLADGGEDTVENAIALCPNCHRELHYGQADAQPFHRADAQPAVPVGNRSRKTLERL